MNVQTILRRRQGLEKAEVILLLVFALSLPLSIVVAEPAAFLAFGVGCLWMGRAGGSWKPSPLVWPVGLFAFVVVCSVGWSVRPELSMKKLPLLLLLPAIFLLPATIRTEHEDQEGLGWKYLLAFVAGATLLAVYDLVRVPLEVRAGVPLFDTGNMRDPQIYMVAICFALGAIGMWWHSGRRYGLGIILFLLVLGLVLHFKRGVWLSTILAVTLMAVVARKRNWVIGLVVITAALLLLPSVQGRLRLMGDISSQRVGGRYALWTQVAPELLRSFPQGMGWRAVTHDDLAGHARYVQPRLNHLHDNPLQMALELGWLGLAVWVAWMGVALVMMARSIRAGPMDEGKICWIAVGALGAFSGLMINGLVESNFGDTEILMMLCLVMGLAGIVHASRGLDAGAGE